jgi:hypothetical protein
MSEPYGAHEAGIAYISESTYGQTPASPDMVEIITADNVEPAVSPSLIKVRGIGSRDPQFIRKGLRLVDVKFDYALQNIQLLNFISTLGSMSLEVWYEKTAGTVSLLHKGCRMDRAEVQCSIEDIINANVSLIGQDLTVGTAKIGNSYTPWSENPVAFYECYVKKQAATLERVTDWKFVIENHLKRVPVIRTSNGNLLKFLQERHRTISGEVTFEFETKEEYDDVINDTAFTLEIGLGSTNKAVFTDCKWETVGSPTRIEDLVALKAPFTAKGVTIS